MTKNCLQCNKVFAKQYSRSVADFIKRAKFCSRECFDLFKIGKPSHSPSTTFKKGHKLCVGREGLKGSDNPRWKGGNIFLVCKICSKQFEVNRARANAKTCSPECKIAYQRLPENREAMRKIHRERVKAGLHNLYRGVTSLYTLIRKSSQYKQWRTAVYERDGYKCQKCGACGVDLQADHIKQFALILFEGKVKTVDEAIACTALWDIHNGRTLCIPCHKATGTWGVKNFLAITRQSLNNHEQ